MLKGQVLYPWGDKKSVRSSQLSVLTGGKNSQKWQDMYETLKWELGPGKGRPRMSVRVFEIYRKF